MALKERVTQIGQTKAWYGEFPTYYIYTLGVAGERFFREIKDNARIMGARCAKCDLTYVPPRLYCERCFEKLEEWREVGRRGTVYTYTVAYEALDGSRLEEPEILAFVAMDGAHGGLIHRLDGIKPHEVKIGLAVEAIFKPKNQRTGSILDIEHFRPV